MSEFIPLCGAEPVEAVFEPFDQVYPAPRDSG